MKRQRPGIPTQHVLAAYRQVLSDWPGPHESHHLATRAGSTFVVSCGPEHGPALVLLHGTLSNAASWMFDAERWSEYYRVHAVDIIGEPGLSEGTQPALDSDAHAQWLDDVLDALGVESAAFGACRSAASWHWTTRCEGLPGSTHWSWSAPRVSGASVHSCSRRCHCCCLADGDASAFAVRSWVPRHCMHLHVRSRCSTCWH